MSGNQRRKSPARNRGRARPPQPFDMWRPAAQPLPDIEPIAATTEPAALLRSLGDPPLPGNAVVAGHYVATVVERAAALATALAASADLLEEEDD